MSLRSHIPVLAKNRCNNLGCLSWSCVYVFSEHTGRRTKAIARKRLQKQGLKNDRNPNLSKGTDSTATFSASTRGSHSVRTDIAYLQNAAAFTLSSSHAHALVLHKHTGTYSRKGIVVFSVPRAAHAHRDIFLHAEMPPAKTARRLYCAGTHGCLSIRTHLFLRKTDATTSAVCRGLVTQLLRLRFQRAHLS